MIEFTFASPVWLVADAESSRYALNYVRVITRPTVESGLEGVAVATDGRRIAMCSVAMTGYAGKALDGELMVPVPLLTRPSERPFVVWLDVDRKQWLRKTKAGDLLVMAPYVEASGVGRFPNVAGLLTDESVGELLVSLDAEYLRELTAAIDDVQEGGKVTLFRCGKHAGGLVLAGHSTLGIFMTRSEDENSVARTASVLQAMQSRLGCRSRPKPPPIVVLREGETEPRTEGSPRGPWSTMVGWWRSWWASPPTTREAVYDAYDRMQDL